MERWLRFRCEDHSVDFATDLAGKGQESEWCIVRRCSSWSERNRRRRLGAIPVKFEITDVERYNSSVSDIKIKPLGASKNLKRLSLTFSRRMKMK